MKRLTLGRHRRRPHGSVQLYRYLNFGQIDGFSEAGRVVRVEEEQKLLAEV